MADYSVDAELKANVRKFKKAIEQAKDVTEKFKRASESVEDTELKADIKQLRSNIKEAKRLMEAFTKGKAEKEVDADIKEFEGKLGFLMAAKKALSKKVFIPIEARVGKFQKTMDRIAKTISSFGIVAGNIFKGGLLTVLPTLSPIIASLTGALGGLTSAFAAAGTGAVAFGSVATSALNDVFTANEDIKKLREELANTTDLEKRAEILKEIEQTTNGLSKSQQKGLKAVQSFSKFWGKFAKQFEKPVMDVFVRSLEGLQGLIKQLEPAFKGAVSAVDTLSKSMGESIKSKEFQEFVDFLNKNAGPAMVNLGKTFGNIMQGIMNLMVAFGPLSTDMQGGLVGLTEKFKNWTAGLKDSEAFNKFINYIKENGPKVMALIGNLTTFLVELGKGMAPIGSSLLDIVNKFMSFTNALMQNNPLIGQALAIFISLSGALLAIAPVIIMVRSAFGGLATSLVTNIAKMWKAFSPFRTNMIVGLKMWGQSLKKGIVNVAKWAKTTITKFIQVAAKYSWMAIKATVHAAKVAATFTVTMVKAAAKATAKMIASMAKMIAKYAWMGAKSLVHAAKVASSWVIAMGPVGWVIATIVGLVAVIVANWDKVKNWTVKTWDKVWGTIKEIVDNIWNKITDVFGNIVDFFDGINLYDSGKAIIQSAIDGIVHMKDKILGKVEEIVGAVRDYWPFSPAKRGPLSDIHRMDFAGPIKDSIKRAKKPLERATSGLAGSVNNSFRPDLKVKASQISSSLRGIKRSSTAQVQSAVNADVSISKQPAEFIFNLGRQQFKVFVEDITTVQNRTIDLQESFQG
ncbi:hypothetical protein [Virgibacillus salexigens]|uniref:hypothetical protein n=1 Tax=Virgibacillus salexigens TaxID=61016 RepID=UPI003081E6DD